MKNSNITENCMRVALLLVLAASIIGLVPAFSSSARAGSFSASSVEGIYVDHGEGWTTGNGSNIVPFSAVGLITFTPATGTFHADLIGRQFAQNNEHVVDGTYTVDATGHGTMTWRNGAKHRDFYIVNGGAELQWINTDPPDTAEIVSSSGT